MGFPPGCACHGLAAGPIVAKLKQTGPMPEFVSPMKPVLVDRLPEGSEWTYEVKWDGYRALAIKNGDRVQLLSRKNRDLARTFPQVVKAIASVHAGTAVLDGEIVAVNAQGQPSFQALQNRSFGAGKWQVVFYAFDLLNCEGQDLRSKPLSERRALLEKVVANSFVRFSAALQGSAEVVCDAVTKAGLEGIVAKRIDSTYTSANRSRTWQKLKLLNSEEFVIGGYNPDPSSFSSILVGYYEGKELVFAGKVKHGLNPRLRAVLLGGFKKLSVRQCPFVNLPVSKTGRWGEGVTAEDMEKLKWVRPMLVAEIGFTEWTAQGLLRHATFRGLREDKNPTEVIREKTTK